MTASDHARRAYDLLGDAYDLIAGADYPVWTANLERAAAAAGLRGRRLLDVACGTGGSFLPMLDRGYAVTACDISPRMAAIAGARAGGRAEVVVADVRELPALGAFDLCWALNDSLNYLVEPGELDAALRGIARNLAPGGVFVADFNTVATLRQVFGGLVAVPGEDRVLVWRGSASGRSAREGDLVTAELEVLSRDPAGAWTSEVGVHVQRHHPGAAVRRAVAAAGLRLAAVYGMPPGVELRERRDEGDAKRVYVAVAAA